jgi:hypothetical protein
MPGMKITGRTSPVLLHAFPVAGLALKKPAPLAMIWVEDDSPSERVDGWRLDCGAGDLPMWCGEDGLKHPSLPDWAVLWLAHQATTHK